jgi:hypothetical protein
LFEEQQTDYVKVDERSYTDLIQFTIDYASKIQFWDVFNRRSGDWTSFMEKGQASIYTNIANTNTSKYKEEFDAFYQGNFLATANAQDNTEGMVQKTFELATILDGWLAELEEDLELTATVKNVIQRQAAPLIRTLLEYDKGANDSLGVAYDSNVVYADLSDFWNLDLSVDSNLKIFGSGTISDKAINARRYFLVLFQSMINVLENLQVEANNLFEELLEDYGKHDPYFGLFLAFIQLFRHAQDHVNEFTDAHLDFYYRDVLQLTEKSAVSDSVHVVLEPAKNVSQKKVEKGTSVKAGKDADGNDIIFETDSEIVINKAKVSELKSIYIDRGRNSKYIQTIYAASQSNSADGEGKAFTEENPSWEAFGKTQVNDGIYIEDQTMDLARVGLGICSPEFKLSEGNRKLTISFILESGEFVNTFEAGGTFENFLSVNALEYPVGTAVPNTKEGYAILLSNWITLRLSGSEGWLSPDNIDTNGLPSISIGQSVEGELSTMVIELTLSREQAAIVSYNSELHGQSYSTEWPVLEILMNQAPTTHNEEYQLAYDFLKNLRFERFLIGTEAEGVTNLVLANDTGTVDPSKPFMPFSSNPQVGSNFYVGSAEIFSKRLSYLQVKLDWKGVPSDDFSEHYKHYLEEQPASAKNGYTATAVPIVDDNDHFTAQLKMLDNYGWKDLSHNSSATRELHQSSEIALSQKKWVMTYPVSFFLMALYNAFTAHSEENYLMWDNPVQRDLDTNNFVHLFRTGELIDRDVLSDGSFNYDNDEDARLPRKIVVQSKENGYAHTNAEERKNNFDLLTLDENTDIRYKRDETLVELKEYSTELKRGFIKFELINDFFHAAYPKNSTERALKNPSVYGGVGMPNIPYTPELHKVSVDYKSTHDVNYSPGIAEPITWENRVEQIYHILPFGEVEVLPTEGEKELEDESGDVYFSKRILPKLFKDAKAITSEGLPETKIDLDTGRSIDIILEETAEGTLLIGISDLEPPQALSLLFQFKEGTEDNDLEVPAVQWSFLSKNQWECFDTAEIVEDTTNGLVNSGIIKFSVSHKATNDSTFLKNGLYWFRAQVAGNTEAFSNLVSVHAQAVKATFVDNENNPYRLNTEIPSETVSKFVNKDFEIKTISQPYESFGGRIKEQSAEYYTRVAERLRHKQRGITIRDYEHLVLEEFPGIYKVKCINHTSKFSEYSPGNVSVIVIPYFKNKNEKNPFELKVSKAKLSEIRKFLVKLNSPFVDLSVRNPKYETIRVEFGVEFHIGYDRTYYENQLNEDIKEFISPWAFGKEEEIIFGGKINRSVILNFIEEREYVDFVTQFRMYHKRDENKAELEVFVAEGTTASSVLVTALDHEIKGPACTEEEEEALGEGSFDSGSHGGTFD